MTSIAIIGGSGLTNLKNLQTVRREAMHTPYGEASAPIVFGRLSGHEVLFLARHGEGHAIPPHAINYRANLWALKQAGANNVIAVNAVGAIRNELEVADLVVPDQIIDYTHGREHTFFSSEHPQVTHVDFSQPYCESLRRTLIAAAERLHVAVTAGATYAATQGPRFETAAEIRRCERDGADIVGMTGMPEASLARELDLCYAALAVVANPAAGKATGALDIKEIEKHLATGMERVLRVLEQTISMLAGRDDGL